MICGLWIAIWIAAMRIILLCGAVRCIVNCACLSSVHRCTGVRSVSFCVWPPWFILKHLFTVQIVVESPMEKRSVVRVSFHWVPPSFCFALLSFPFSFGFAFDPDPTVTVPDAPTWMDDTNAKRSPRKRHKKVLLHFYSLFLQQPTQNNEHQWNIMWHWEHTHHITHTDLHQSQIYRTHSASYL